MECRRAGRNSAANVVTKFVLAGRIQSIIAGIVNCTGFAKIAGHLSLPVAVHNGHTELDIRAVEIRFKYSYYFLIFLNFTLVVEMYIHINYIDQLSRLFFLNTS